MKTITLIITTSILFCFLSCNTEVNSPVITSISVKEHILPGYYITAITFDSKGTAWLGTFHQGLIRYDGNTIVFEPGDELPDSIIIWDVAVDKKDNVWIGTNAGLIKYNGSVFSTYNTSNSPLPLDLVWSIAVDNDNTLWLSSCRFREGGLVTFNDEGWQIFTPDNSMLPSNGVKDISVDKNNNVWLAMSETVNGGGIIKISGNSWYIFDEDKIGIKLYYLHEIVVSDNGYVYTSLDYSLSSSINFNRPNIIEFNGKKWNVRNPVDEKGKPLGYAGAICTDHYGNLWSSIWWNDIRLAVYNKGKWVYNYFDFSKVSITTLKCDAKNEVWAGTTDGIYLINYR